MTTIEPGSKRHANMRMIRIKLKRRPNTYIKESGSVWHVRNQIYYGCMTQPL